MVTQERDNATVISTSASSEAYVDWGAIFAGAIIATAISFVLLTFASGIGLSMSEPMDRDGFNIQTIAILTGLWLISVQLVSFGIGGYISGRMRAPCLDASNDEVAVRDGVHGLAMWALAALVGAYLATTTVGKNANTVMSAASSTALNVTSAVTDTWLAKLTENDRNEIAAIVQRRTGLSEAEARSQVTTTLSIPATVNNVSKAGVAKTADKAAFFASIMAFLIAASTLLAGVVAWWAADLGGHHRDTNRPLSAAYRWRS